MKRTFSIRQSMLALALSSIVLAQQATTLTFPAPDWQTVRPESAGFSTAKFEALRAWLKTQQTTAMMVTSGGGKVIFEYGDLKQVSKVNSVRKSVLAMLFGKYVSEGKADLDKTVEQLGLRDVQPFLPIEKSATLYDLLTARSGIYHPSGNEELSSVSPRRGAQPPGTYFQYQNWDFNAAGTAFEKLTGKNIFDAIESDLAKPIGMQDWDRSRQRKISSMPDSVHPEFATYLSTRDQARLGLLMLADGNWNGKQIMPKGWADRITTLVTPHENMNPVAFRLRTFAGRWGYGLQWWVWDAPRWRGAATGPYQGAYMAAGANGQYIAVFPSGDPLIISHKVNMDVDGSRNVSGDEFLTIVQMVLNAGCNGGTCK